MRDKGGPIFFSTRKEEIQTSWASESFFEIGCPGNMTNILSDLIKDEECFVILRPDVYSMIADCLGLGEDSFYYTVEKNEQDMVKVSGPTMQVEAVIHKTYWITAIRFVIEFRSQSDYYANKKLGQA